MIILSGVLVVLAIALLVTGIVTGNTGHEVAGLDGLKLIYISIGVSIVAAVCLAIWVFLRRKELFGVAGSPAATAKTPAAARKTGKLVKPAKAKARVGAGDDTKVSMVSAAATDVPAETTVYVVPGRKRYHLETCRQLAGRDKEELTFVEARDEGFTACTACLPDTALAARAATTDIPPADDRATADRSADVPAGTEAERPAEATLTDLPVTDDRPAPEPGDEPEMADEAASHPDTAEDTADQDTAGATAGTETAHPADRSKSIFEPLERADATAADDDDTAGTAGVGKDVTADAEATAEREDVAGREDVAPGLAEDGERAEAEDTAAVGSRRTSGAEPDHEADHEAGHEPGHEADAVTGEADHADHEADRGHADDIDGADEIDDRRDAVAPEPLGGAENEDLTETPVTADAAEETAAAASEHDAGDAESARRSAALDDHDAADQRAADHDATGERAMDDHDAVDDVAAPDPERVRILSGTKRYHRPDCALIEDIAEDADDMETLSRAAAKERGCTPCLVCQPDRDPADLD